MRCGLCGSRQISLVNDSSYSFKKGIIGTAVLGPVGAVAGINGNQSMKYHCMACGQDALSIMDQSREQQIDDALARGDRELLDTLRVTWRNIEYPFAHPFSDTEIANIDDIGTIPNESEMINKGFETEILEHISGKNMVFYDDLCAEYDNSYAFRSTFRELEEKGYIKRTSYKGETYVEKAKTIEEMHEFSLIGIARNYTFEKYINTIFNVCNNAKSITEKEIIDDFHLSMDLVDGNPYMKEMIVKNCLDRLVTEGRLELKGSEYSVASTVKYEQDLKMEIAKRIKERHFRETDMRFNDLYVLKNEIIDVLKKNGRLAKDDIQNKSTMLKKESLQHIGAYLRQLSDDGKVVVEGGYYSIIPGAKKYKVIDIPPIKKGEIDLYGLHEEDSSKKILNILKSVPNKKWDINEISRVFNQKNENEQKDIVCLVEILYLHQEGWVENTIEGSCSWWTYVDANKEKREKLLRELEEIKGHILRLQDELIEANKKYDEEIKIIENEDFCDNPELVEKIKANQQKMNELERIKPSLKGFWKRKQLYNTEEELKRLYNENSALKKQEQEELELYENNKKLKILELSKPKTVISDRIASCNHEIQEKEKEIQRLS